VIGHHRLVIEQPRLRHVGHHPRPALLVVACEVVGEEQRQRLAVGVEYLEHPHIRLVDGQVPAFLETQAIQLVRGVEHTVQQHVIELEVRRDECLIEIVACLAHLLRIERPVPRLQGEGRRAAHLRLCVDQLLDVGGFGARAHARRRGHLADHVAHRGRVAGRLSSS